ncbi:MAG: heme NO-binding domain-containing protein [Nitrospiraceae bacterium]
MKGIVFNLLEELVRREHGENTWDALLESAGLDGVYTSLGSYADAELMKLVAAASSALHSQPDTILRWFGRKAMPLLAEKYPSFFATQKSARPFLLTLNDIIHPEVRKLYPGAVVPVFDFDTSSPDTLIMGYTSERKLCALAQGFVEGAADHYGEDLSFEQTQCMHRGDEKCVFRMQFRKPGP